MFYLASLNYSADQCGFKIFIPSKEVKEPEKSLPEQLEEMSKKELLEVCERMGKKCGEKMTKSEIIKELLSDPKGTEGQVPN